MATKKTTGKKLADMMYGNPEGAAFGITPMIGKRREDRQDREAAKSFPVDLARGVVAGAAGMPGDIESLIRMLPGLDERTILPTSEDVLKRIPFGTDTPAGRFASGLGTLAGGSAPIGPAIRGAKALPGALKTAARNLSTPSTLNPQAGAIVYHGSPHKFDKFDASKIGTGEGAQAYGHGLYLAEDRGIADVYRKKLTNVDGAPVGSPNESLQVAIGRLQSEINKLRQSDDPSAPAMIRAYEGRIQELDNAGSLYTVDLPDEKIARMLDWDKPLSEQPEVIRALKGTDYEVGMSQREAEKLADIQIRQEADDWADMTGGDPVDYSNNVDWEKYVDQIRKDSGSIDSSITGKDFHRMVMRDEGYRPELFDPENYQVGTSEALRGYDIPGIKYLDANSRDAGKGTRNFVVFPGEEDALTIVDRKKDGGPVHFSDNPDVMQLELAAGGLVKGIKAAAKAVKPAEAPMKASEALGRIEGRPLVITQSDRTKVGGGFLGGPGFSSLQLTEPEYRAAEAVWGVKTPGVAKMILGGGKKAGPDPVYTTFIGTPNQHQSNQMVFDKLYGDFKKSAKKGGLEPELQEKINYRLANAVDKDGRPIFPPDVNILDKNFKDLATTFDQRAVTSSLIGGLGVGGKKGQIVDYDKIIRNTTDPALLDAPSGALGNRLFTLSGGIIDRPDLHPAFPTILQGEDMGVSFDPVVRDLVMKDFIEKTMREKGRTPGYMDYTRGHPPSQLITEDILTEMQKLGLKKGGAVRKAAGGEITADDLILEERKL